MLRSSLYVKKNHGTYGKLPCKGEHVQFSKILSYRQTDTETDTQTHTLFLYYKDNKGMEVSLYALPLQGTFYITKPILNKLTNKKYPSPGSKFI